MVYGKLAKKILTLLGISLDSKSILDKLDNLLHEEYQTLKEENEKLKRANKNYKNWAHLKSKKIINLQQQRDELVEMLEKVINNLTYPTEFLRNIRDEAEQLLQKIK